MLLEHHKEEYGHWSDYDDEEEDEDDDVYDGYGYEYRGVPATALAAVAARGTGGVVTNALVASPDGNHIIIGDASDLSDRDLKLLSCHIQRSLDCRATGGRRSLIQETDFGGREPRSERDLLLL